jgi:hypothetical protein
LRLLRRPWMFLGKEGKSRYKQQCNQYASGWWGSHTFEWLKFVMPPAFAKPTDLASKLPDEWLWASVQVGRVGATKRGLRH